MPSTPAWLASLEALVNRRIADVPRAREAARRLEGASLRLDVEGLWSVRAVVLGERFVLATGDGASTVRIAGSPGALIELALKRGAAGASAANGGRSVRIEGDAEVAARYRELLRLVRPDLEEELARLVGDLPARMLGRFARAAGAWAARARRSAADDLREYLTEERRVLVSRGELDEFLLEVDRVRETADRIEARLARLERLRARTGPAGRS